MAWSTGDLITAAKLNSENSGKFANYYSYDGWGSTSVTSDWHYIHQTTGRIMYLRSSGTAYWWSKGTAWFEFRDASGTVSRINLWSNSGNVNKTREATIYIESYGYGPGWYRGYSYQNRGRAEVNIYWGQDNCWPGGKLVYWDNPTNSGNRIPGQLLTADILNSGRVGVI